MLELNSGIYLIRNTANAKLYVGSAVNFRIRWRDHKYSLNKNIHRNILLNRAWNKYGEDKFIFEVLEQCSKEKLIEREQFYIDNLKPQYNICKNAASRLGQKCSEEHKLKTSLALKGIRRSEETKKKISLAKMGHFVSKETRIKIGLASSNRKVSDETKLKLSIAQKGKIHSLEARLKMSLAKQKRKMENLSC